jgi:hypothetical protein
LAEELGGEIDAEDDAVDEGYGTEDHGGGGMRIAGYWFMRLECEA